jgi:hypothetical protein
MGLSPSQIENVKLRRIAGTATSPPVPSVAVYEQDPIRQPGRGGLLNFNPAGTQSGRLGSVPEMGWELMDPVVSGSAAVSNLWDQR